MKATWEEVQFSWKSGTGFRQFILKDFDDRVDVDLFIWPDVPKYKVVASLANADQSFCSKVLKAEKAVSVEEAQEWALNTVNIALRKKIDDLQAILADLNTLD